MTELAKKSPEEKVREEEQNEATKAEETGKEEQVGTGKGNSFTFRRMSGLDQAILENDEEWRNLGKLDQKLWMAMSCPVAGLEFSSAALAALDTDNDGRIRSADVLDAVAWVCERVSHPSCFRSGGDNLPLNILRKDSEAGRELLAAAELTLEKSGDPGTGEVSPEQIDAVLAEAEGYAFNGDGVVPADSADKPELEEYIRAAISTVGAKKDASGKPGLDAELAREFAARLEATKAFRKRVAGVPLPLDGNTAAAWTLLTRLEAKIDDYFNRCRVADFAPATLAALNEDYILAGANLAGDSVKSVPGGAALTENLAETLQRMPLARIAADAPLPLARGVNPAWLDAVSQFRNLFAPLLPKGAKSENLPEEAWLKIKSVFAPYAAALESKPIHARPPVDAERLELPDLAPLALAAVDDPLKRVWEPLTPNENLDALSDEQIDLYLAPDAKDGFAALVAKDLAAPKMTAIQDLKRLALFHAHLYTFLMNFVSFVDFYDPEKKAIFQTGVLYLDSRACSLCVPVDDLETHVRLAGQSHLCLIYCQCQRTAADGATLTSIIAAALTAGDLAALIDGRHGLFIDNEGREWDTKIIRIAHNPISLREAAWAPYIRISNLIGEQAQKFLASKEEAVSKAAGNAVSSIAAPPKAAEKQSFDFAKGAGIFAAVSVAISVLSAAFAYIANSLASLGWWWPLALLGVIVCISGPSMLIAWFKLRRRSLGPLLDASGWAVNQGAPINLVMGDALTSVGKMPPNANRYMDDPYGLSARLLKRKSRAKFWFWLILFMAAIVAACFVYYEFFGLPEWAAQFLNHLNPRSK